MRESKKTKNDKERGKSPGLDTRVGVQIDSKKRPKGRSFSTNLGGGMKKAKSDIIASGGGG